MKQMLFVMMMSLAAVTVVADDDWSSFWDRVAAERAKTAPKGAQIGSASIAAFESGRHSGVVAADAFDSETRTRSRSNAIAKFSSEPPTGLSIIIR